MASDYSRAGPLPLNHRKSAKTAVRSAGRLKVPSVWQRMKDGAYAIGPLWRSARSLSFAQFGEDVVLSVAAFPRKKGFYVDVGAYHPWRSSNTYKLYLRGWFGLTVEPNPAMRDAFRRYRSRDIHVMEGIAETDGKLTYRQFRDSKLNTFSSELAAEYELRGARRAGEISVPCRPLQTIIDQYARNARIDLLSVDCEGYDLVVLQTLDFTRSRPTVILIEDFAAFESLSVGKAKSDIERFLRDRGYAPVCQAVLSTLYVDIASVRANDTTVYDFRALRIPYSDHLGQLSLPSD